MSIVPPSRAFGAFLFTPDGATCEVEIDMAIVEPNPGKGGAILAEELKPYLQKLCDSFTIKKDKL